MKRNSAGPTEWNLMKNSSSVKFVRFFQKKFYILWFTCIFLYSWRVLNIFLNQRQSLIVPLLMNNVLCNGFTKGACRHLPHPPPLEVLPPPHLPPVRRKKQQKSAIYSKIFGFFVPSEMHFYSSMPPQKISGAATGVIFISFRYQPIVHKDPGSKSDTNSFFQAWLQTIKRKIGITYQYNRCAYPTMHLEWRPLYRFFYFLIYVQW